ncbi:flagellin B [Campylobacter hyointestinalis]|uniref:flagellin B n=1 Tax=Campylobacter hyointestinalis TaxID=198 RepID=UPI00072586E4|nr:flagellin B [Campylobacter hyointestinalis]CUU82969.1 flagellin B [Campylobacter hyointestinalis subsp. hyointestinalis]CUU88722.1 flagellin B [Campylobacter hyointestinalis subsp. hyointestinalis]
MGFRINTNIGAMNAHANSVITNRNLDSSLGRLSSGLRISTAADDASGMSIADSLRAQANGLGQAIKNGNDAIGIVQTADKAMDEQIKILDTIKTKAIQAAQDGQNADSRRALQNDISRLLEELDNIAKTTSFNGQKLLNGNFSNKEFQIGAYSNETVKLNIGSTESGKIGYTRFESTGNIAFSKTKASSDSMADLTIKLSGVDGYPAGYVFDKISKSVLAKDGLKAVADAMNAVSDKTGVKAKVNNVLTFSNTVLSGSMYNLRINGVNIGSIDVQRGDKNGVLVNAINKVKDQTGVEASVQDGKLTLASKDGRAITIAASSKISQATEYKGNLSLMGLGKKGSDTSGITVLGRLTFIRQDARDIRVVFSGKVAAAAAAGFSVMAGLNGSKMNQASVTLKDMNSGTINSKIAMAMGFYDSNTLAQMAKAQQGGVNTFTGAQAMIDIAESAQKMLDSIRSDLGSVQNQLVSTINNITVTRVNVASAESQIRDVDFAEESANFSKFNILAQSGSYAMSQANTVQQNVLRLLQ